MTKISSEIGKHNSDTIDLSMYFFKTSVNLRLEKNWYKKYSNLRGRTGKAWLQNHIR
jgi:hypothetical protein